MNAKKLDFNFDGDDFFNSFDPSAKKVEVKPLPEPSKIEIIKKDVTNESGALKFGQNIKTDDKSKSTPFADFAKEEDFFNVQMKPKSSTSIV